MLPISPFRLHSQSLHPLRPTWPALLGIFAVRKPLGCVLSVPFLFFNYYIIILSTGSLLSSNFHIPRCRPTSRPQFTPSLLDVVPDDMTIINATELNMVGPKMQHQQLQQPQTLSKHTFLKRTCNKNAHSNALHVWTLFPVGQGGMKQVHVVGWSFVML